MSINSAKEKVRKDYDKSAGSYINMYKQGYNEYPANLIRLNIVIKRLRKNKLGSVLDAGCGSCGPMIRLLGEGFKVKGFDFSDKMVKEGKRELIRAGFNPELINRADLENEKGLPKVKFDAVLALGVFPHILNEQKALRSIGKRLSNKGLAFISFRNEIFAAYTLNRYSLDFFMDRLTEAEYLPKKAKDMLASFYLKRLGIKPVKKKHEDKAAMLSKFHNPLDIEKKLFRPAGFRVKNIHFYHYHALPPLLEKEDPYLFRNLSLKMEDPSDWKGYFMASAFVIEARKNA